MNEFFGNNDLIYTVKTATFRLKCVTNKNQMLLYIICWIILLYVCRFGKKWLDLFWKQQETVYNN